MSETQIKDKDFDNIPLEVIPLCRFCSQSTEEALIQVCQCQGVLQWVHFNCLSNHIKQTRNTKCALCRTTFTGIVVKTVPLSFCTFIRNKEDILAQIICYTFGFLFLYYILYMALIDFILSDGLVHIVFRILLIVPTVFYATLFSVLIVASLITLFIKYKRWSQRNHRIVVELLNKKGEPKTPSSKSSGSKHQAQNTSVSPKKEEKSNHERVAIDMEVTQSTDNKSEQTVKVNKTDDNRQKVEIKQKGQ